MASLVAGNNPLLCLLFVLAVSSSQSHARESMFFSKTTRHEAPNEASTTIPNMKEEPMRLPPQSRNGYGLYGRGSGQFSSATTTATTNPDTTNNNNNNNNNNEHRDDIPSSFSGTEFVDERYRNKESEVGYHNENDNAGKFPSRFPSDEFHGGSSKIPRNSDQNELNGMSDTRFLENGKYFYDVSGESYGKGYESTSDEFGRDGSNTVHGDNGNGDSNPMEGYDKQGQEGNFP